MDELAEPPSPPADFPYRIASLLQELDVHDLRETIIYAQELLQYHQEPTDQIEPAPGEEIVELTEHPGYVEVVKRQPCAEGCQECPHGPFIYHVQRERHPNGREKFHWVLIGRHAAVDS